MRFELGIDLGNAAFHDDENVIELTELARILADASERVAEGNCNFRVRDFNGNTVGEAKLVKDFDELAVSTDEANDLLGGLSYPKQV